MGTGILVCGLNGAGKSTLGRALADRLGYHFIDNEHLYFPNSSTSYRYGSPCTEEEAQALLAREIEAHSRFVFAAVKGMGGERFLPCYACAVWVDVPREVRLQRVYQRSFQRFGERMLPGGDLHEQESRFLALCQSRDVRAFEEWLRTLPCPLLRIDGTRSIEENLREVGAWLQAAALS